MLVCRNNKPAVGPVSAKPCSLHPCCLTQPEGVAKEFEERADAICIAPGNTAQGWLSAEDGVLSPFSPPPGSMGPLTPRHEAINLARWFSRTTLLEGSGRASAMLGLFSFRDPMRGPTTIAHRSAREAARAARGAALPSSNLRMARRKRLCLGCGAHVSGAFLKVDLCPAPAGLFFGRKRSAHRSICGRASLR